LFHDFYHHSFVCRSYMHIPVLVMLQGGSQTHIQNVLNKYHHFGEKN